MRDLRPARCPITGDTDARLVFAFDAPPAGEVGFRRQEGQPYYREVWQFARSRHYVGCHNMSVATGYQGDYVDASYGSAAGLAAAFERVIKLPAERSDNEGRIARVRAFAEHHFGTGKAPTLLDVGAGLGVFPRAVKRSGWRCTAIDPDQRAVEHIRSVVGVDAICGDFMTLENSGRFDIVTFNKVLEHVADPVAMLRRAGEFVTPNGFIYVELPDGEAAAAEGPGREEFFIEHLHGFSFLSMVLLAQRAGLTPVAAERLREPSTKFTLRAFLTVNQNDDPGATA